MQQDFSQEPAVLGRDLKDLEKYGSQGTAYLGKVVMSSGEKPVLGRKVMVDVSRPHLMLICGKRGGGKCVVGETEILLEDGSLVKIKDLKNDSRKIIALNDSFKLNAENKNDFFEREVDKVIKIKTNTGREITLTPEHPLFTIDGWKPVMELSVGKRIAVPRKIGFFGNNFLTEAQVKLLAYLTTKGNTAKGKTAKGNTTKGNKTKANTAKEGVSKKDVWFTNFDKKIQEDFFASVKEFDERLVVKKMKNNEGKFRVVNKYSVNKYSKEIKKNQVGENNYFGEGTQFEHMNYLRDWLIGLGVYGQLESEKELPKEIFSLNEQKTALLLNRMFSCDGTIWKEKNKYKIEYASSSKKLIKQVQHLLLKFGVISTLREKKIFLGKKEFNSFELIIEGIFCKEFINKIGFFGEKELKQKELQLLFSQKKFNPNLDTVPFDTIPKEIWNYYTPTNWVSVGKKLGYKYTNSLRENKFYSPTREKLLQIAIADENELIQNLAKSDIYWDEIKEITEINEKTKVYDISVPQNHNFVANDIIIHNSYTLAVLMEEMARLDSSIRSRISTITIDTVGIFWGLKLPAANIDNAELSAWDLKADKTNVQVLVPRGQLNFYKEKGLPIDGAFTLKCSELEETEWMALST